MFGRRGYEFQWDVVWENMPLLLSGLRLTLFIAITVLVISTVAGLGLAILRLRGPRPLAVFAYVYTEFFRSIPSLIFLIWIFWTVPILTPWSPAAVTAAILGLSFSLSAFLAEVFRSGIQAIAGGQWQAASALGMTERQVMRRIIVPQAVRRVIPPYLSVWLGLFKDTSFVSIIGVTDLMFVGRRLSIQTFRPLEVLTTVAIIYFLVAFPQGMLVNHLYERLVPKSAG